MLDSIFALTSAGAANLMQPAVLFFGLGLMAAFARSDLALPGNTAKMMSLYLMLCIGFKGGVEARLHGLDPTFLKAGLMGLALSFLLPLPAFALLRRAGLDRVTAAATAAHYGSVSVVTFAAGMTFLDAVGAAPGGYMAAVLALMETPAILTGLWLALRASKASPSEAALVARPSAAVWREVLFNGASVLLIGSFLIGLVTGAPGKARLDVFVGPIFQGVLCLFLLDLGVTAAKRLREAGRLRFGVLAMGVVLPLLGASIGLILARLGGLALGDAAILAILAGSASYIAAPAAMRLALPKADAGVYLTLALGVTFPFNLLIGIPLYHAVAALWIG
jgi:hypothetical protein